MQVVGRTVDGAPLLPGPPATARPLLRAGPARVGARCPCTIQRTWPGAGQGQDVVVGIDQGRCITGIRWVANGHVLLAAAIHHRRAVHAHRDPRRA